MTICFHYIAQPGGGGGGGGYGKPTAHAHVMMLEPLTSRSNAMPSKKTMESLRTFVIVKTVLRHGRMFQGSDEV